MVENLIIPTTGLKQSQTRKGRACSGVENLIIPTTGLKLLSQGKISMYPLELKTL